MAKAYADWVTRSPELKGASQFIIDPPALYAAGIEPVYVPTRLPLGSPSAMNTRTTRVKNSVDVKMTADCIECAHTYPNIGTYVLVSGDSDFIHVINSLRAIGKRVIIIGVSWSTSRRLADQVDGLILYDIDVDPEHLPEPEPTPASTERSSRSNGGNRQQLSEVMRQIEEIVRSERQAGRTPLLTSLKQRIMRRVPGFDEKKLGFSGFKKLMLRTAEEGTIKLVTVGLVDWVIMADEPDPVEAHSEPGSDRGSVETVAADEEVVLDDQSRSEPTAVVETAAESDSAVSDVETTSTEAAGQPAEAGETDITPETLVAAETSSESDSLTVELPTETEASSDAGESEAMDEVAPPALSPELATALEETLAHLELPRGPGDGQDGRRINDLVIMADMLEHQAGITHVAFNFLLAQICEALHQGLEAEHPEITGRWGGRTYSRTYVTRLLRELGDKEIFLRDWHQERNEETGRTSRFRTFNLNRTHPLVREALISQWGPDTNTGAHEPEVAVEEAPEAPPEMETSDQLTAPTGEVAMEETVEEETPAPPARTARRRGGRRQSVSEATETSDQAVSEAEAPESVADEAVAAPPARPSRRRGRQLQTAEDVPQTSEQAPEQPGAEEAEPGESEVVEAAPARPSRRRGRQRQTAEEVPQTPEQASEQPSAEEAGSGESEVVEGAPARPSRRRGRQRQTAEDVPQTPEQVSDPSEAGASDLGGSEVVETPPARPSRRRGRQRQTAEEVSPSSEQVAGPSEAGASESAIAAVVEDPVPDAEPAPAAVD